MSAEIPCIADLYDLIESVFDDRVGKTGGDVRYRSSLLLGLLDVGIHENGASGAEISRMLGVEGLLCEILHAVA